MTTKLPVLVLGTVWLMVLAAIGAGCSVGGSAPRFRVPQPAPLRRRRTRRPCSLGCTAEVAGRLLLPAKDPGGPSCQRTARVALDVATFDSTLNDVIAIVDQAGGYISGSQARRTMVNRCGLAR